MKWFKRKLGLEIDDDGNYYDPTWKDMDNDGIPDRYDNDFRSSNYFESTYDVDGLKKMIRSLHLENLKSIRLKLERNLVYHRKM